MIKYFYNRWSIPAHLKKILIKIFLSFIVLAQVKQSNINNSVPDIFQAINSYFQIHAPSTVSKWKNQAQKESLLSQGLARLYLMPSIQKSFHSSTFASYLHSSLLLTLFNLALYPWHIVIFCTKIVPQKMISIKSHQTTKKYFQTAQS